MILLTSMPNNVGWLPNHHSVVPDLPRLLRLEPACPLDAKSTTTGMVVVLTVHAMGWG